MVCPLVEDEWWKRFDDVFGVLTGTELSSAASAEREAVPAVVAAPGRMLVPSAPATPALETTSRRRGELLGLELDRMVGVVVVPGFVDGLVVTPVGDVLVGEVVGVVPDPDEGALWAAGAVAVGVGAVVNVTVPGCSPTLHEVPQVVLPELELLLLLLEPPWAFDVLPDDAEPPVDDVTDALLWLESLPLLWVWLPPPPWGPPPRPALPPFSLPPEPPDPMEPPPPRVPP